MSPTAAAILRWYIDGEFGPPDPAMVAEIQEMISERTDPPPSHEG